MNSKPNEPIPQYLLRCLKIGSATWNHCIRDVNPCPCPCP